MFNRKSSPSAACRSSNACAFVLNDNKL
jgi:hypothetical protein